MSLFGLALRLLQIISSGFFPVLPARTKYPLCHNVGYVEPIGCCFKVSYIPPDNVCFPITVNKIAAFRAQKGTAQKAIAQYERYMILMHEGR